MRTSLLPAVILLAAGLAARGQTPDAPDLGGETPPPNSTVIQSDELHMDQINHIAVFTGNVLVTGTNFSMKCQEMTVNFDKEGKPQPPKTKIATTVKCEKCGGPMGVKSGRRGAFLGCLNYPKCRSTAPLPDDLKEQLGEAATAPAASSGPKPPRRRSGLILKKSRS